MKKVVIATRIYDPEPAAASFRLKTLAEELVQAGYNVEVLTSAYKESPKREITQSGIKIHRAPVLRGKDGYMRGYIQYMSFDIPLFFRLLAHKADLYVNEPPPTTGLVTAIAASIKRGAHIYYAADVWSDAAAGAGISSSVSKALRVVESFVFRHADHVFAVSDGVLQRVSSLGAKNVSTVRNGIDTSVFRPEGEIKKITLGRYFLYAGTMSEWQGAEIFVQALARIHGDYPDIHLVFLGQGNGVMRIRKAVHELHLEDRVHIQDAVSADWAAAYHRGAVAALVSIHPEAGYDFAYPTKTMAAWACGTPTIYAGVGPAKADIKQNNLGWALDYRIEDVADAMVAALENPPERKLIAQWAQENVSFSKRMKAAVNTVDCIVHEKPL